jgi:hypothetical protein
MKAKFIYEFQQGLNPYKAMNLADHRFIDGDTIHLLVPIFWRGYNVFTYDEYKGQWNTIPHESEALDYNLIYDSTIDGFKDRDEYDESIYIHREWVLKHPDLWKTSSKIHEFEQGQDPYKTMGLGRSSMLLGTMMKDLRTDISSNILKDEYTHKGKTYSVGFFIRDPGKGIIRPSQWSNVIPQDWNNTVQIFIFAERFDPKWPTNREEDYFLEEYKINITELADFVENWILSSNGIWRFINNEILEFEQGQDPFKTMGIGEHRPFEEGDKIQLIKKIFLVIDVWRDIYLYYTQEEFDKEFPAGRLPAMFDLVKFRAYGTELIFHKGNGTHFSDMFTNYFGESITRKFIENHKDHWKRI